MTLKCHDFMFVSSLALLLRVSWQQLMICLQAESANIPQTGFVSKTQTLFHPSPEAAILALTGGKVWKKLSGLKEDKAGAEVDLDWVHKGTSVQI